MLRNQTPSLIAINQTTNPAFNDWLCEFATPKRSVEFWSGNAPSDMGPNVNIRRAPTYDKSSTWSRLRTWLHFTIVVGWALIWRQKRSPILVVTNPPFMPLLVLVLHVVLRYRYALLEYDIYPQVTAAMAIVSDKHPIYRLWHWWHKHTLRHAAVTITLSELMADELRQLADCDLPIEVIPNWVDTTWIKPYDRSENKFARGQNFTNETVVLYSGNMGATHSIETILSVAGRLCVDNHIIFLMVGDGTKRVLVVDAIAAGHTPNIRLLPLQPKDMLPQTLASADIGIVTLSEGYENLSMPSKTYGVMAAGNAVLGISPKTSGLAELTDKYSCGANFEPDRVDEIADWIRTLAYDRGYLTALQNAAREAAITHFSKDICLPQLTHVVQNKLIE